MISCCGFDSSGLVAGVVGREGVPERRPDSTTVRPARHPCDPQYPRALCRLRDDREITIERPRKTKEIVVIAVLINIDICSMIIVTHRVSSNEHSRNLGLNGQDLVST